VCMTESRRLFRLRNSSGNLASLVNAKVSASSAADILFAVGREAGGPLRSTSQGTGETHCAQVNDDSHALSELYLTTPSVAQFSSFAKGLGLEAPPTLMRTSSSDTIRSMSIAGHDLIAGWNVAEV